MNKTYLVSFSYAELPYKKGDQKIKSFWRYILWKNQAVWLAEKIFEPKLKNQTIKIYEMIESICCFYGCLPIC